MESLWMLRERTDYESTSCFEQFCTYLEFPSGPLQALPIRSSDNICTSLLFSILPLSSSRCPLICNLLRYCTGSWCPRVCIQIRCIGTAPTLVFLITFITRSKFPAPSPIGLRLSPRTGHIGHSSLCPACTNWWNICDRGNHFFERRVLALDCLAVAFCGCWKWNQQQLRDYGQVSQSCHEVS